MTMNTTKTLMLAAFAALSVGAGTAMAQEGGLSVPAASFYRAPQVTATQPTNPNQVQSGTSDVEPKPLLAPWQNPAFWGGVGGSNG
jgi:hypothetical protein